MKKLILAILFLCGTFTVQSETAKASGATVVFLQVRFQDYIMTSAIRDKVFNSSKLYNVLESSERGLYVSRVDPYIYRLTAYYTSLGYDVELGFEKDESVTFHYYSVFNAIIGVTADEDIIVLLPLPQSATRPERSTSSTEQAQLPHETALDCPK